MSSRLFLVFVPKDLQGVAPQSRRLVTCLSAASFCRFRSICALFFFSAILDFTLSRFLAYFSSWRFFSSTLLSFPLSSVVLLPYASTFPVIASFSPLFLAMLIFLPNCLLLFSFFILYLGQNLASCQYSSSRTFG